MVAVRVNRQIVQKNMPAPNGRFGVMAAVAPRKRQCEFESLYPAGSVVGAATTPSRWDVICHLGTECAE